MKPLFSFAALAVTALAMQSLPLKAQDSTSSSGSTSSSSSSSGSVSGSRSGASTTSGTSSNQQRTNQRVNSTTNNSIPITFNTGGGGSGNGANGANAVDPAGPAGANGSNGSLTPGGSTGAPFYSQSDVTVRSAPPVYAPNVQGGNPCTVGYSVGVSWIGAGVAGGMTQVDQDCADRQAIAMVHNAGYTAEAREMMCNNKAFYMAARTVAKPCAARPQFDGPGAPPPPPIVQQQPVQIAPPPQQVVVKDRTNLPRCSRTVVDNCYGG